MKSHDRPLGQKRGPSSPFAIRAVCVAAVVAAHFAGTLYAARHELRVPNRGETVRLRLCLWHRSPRRGHIPSSFTRPGCRMPKAQCRSQIAAGAAALNQIRAARPTRGGAVVRRSCLAQVLQLVRSGARAALLAKLPTRSVSVSATLPTCVSPRKSSLCADLTHLSSTVDSRVLPRL